MTSSTRATGQAPRVRSAAACAFASLGVAAVAFALASPTLPLPPRIAPLETPPVLERAGQGPWAAGSRVVMISRSDGSTFGASLFYPVEPERDDLPDAVAQDEPPATAGAPFAAIAFGHGFLQEPTRYAGLLAHLATWGFVVVAPASHVGFTPDHAAFASDLSVALDWLEAAAAGDVTEALWLSGKVDGTRMGMMGHSMGGGAALLAAAVDPRVSVVMGLAPAETRPSAVAAMGNVAAPVFALAGDEDRVTPLAQHAVPIFQAAAAPRQLLVLRGGYHCGFQDDPFPIGCDTGSMEAETQLAFTRHLMATVMILYLGASNDLPVVTPVESQELWGLEFPNAWPLLVERDPGIAVNAPPKTGYGHGIVRASITVTRTAAARGRQTLVVSARQGAWPVLTEPLRTPPLGAGETAELAFEVAVPLREPGSIDQDFDEAVIEAWAESDPRTMAFATLLLTRSAGGGPERTPSPINDGRATLPWLGRQSLIR